MTARMTVREALGRCPEFIVLPADGPYYSDVFDRMADALARRCPVVERAGMGRLYANLEGLASLMRRRGADNVALIQAIPPDFEPQLGVAAATTPGRAAKATGDGADYRRDGGDRGYLSGRRWAAARRLSFRQPTGRITAMFSTGWRDALARQCPSWSGREWAASTQSGGAGALYGGEARMIASLIQAVPPDFEPQLGVAAAATPGRAANVTGDGADFRRGRRRDAGRLVLK